MQLANRIQKQISPVLAGLVILLAVLLVISPAEATLGNAVKIVYLHGALERVSTYIYLSAAVVGLGYLVLRRPPLAAWTQALAEVAIGLWVAQFIVSLPAQWLAWGGITLGEPRVNSAAWIMGLTLVIYAVTRWMGDAIWMAVGAVANAAVFLIVMRGTVNILHPFNPIIGSDSLDIKIFYAAIVLTIAIASGMITWGRAVRIETPVSRTSVEKQPVL